MWTLKPRRHPGNFPREINGFSTFLRSPPPHTPSCHARTQAAETRLKVSKMLRIIKIDNYLYVLCLDNMPFSNPPTTRQTTAAPPGGVTTEQEEKESVQECTQRHHFDQVVNLCGWRTLVVALSFELAQSLPTILSSFSLESLSNPDIPCLDFPLFSILMPLDAASFFYVSQSIRLMVEVVLFVAWKCIKHLSHQLQFIHLVAC